mmetsp:Transcript_16001/g.23681  ORF Transcript_16001/g.23681 Transcript_16001/m.23681 type:complete len:82 (-) Transcript_16001:206-451(-)
MPMDMAVDMARRIEVMLIKVRAVSIVAAAGAAGALTLAAASSAAAAAELVAETTDEAAWLCTLFDVLNNVLVVFVTTVVDR